MFNLKDKVYYLAFRLGLFISYFVHFLIYMISETMLVGYNKNLCFKQNFTRKNLYISFQNVV